MIPRRLRQALIEALSSNPSVALLGPRQVGKTTLAFSVKEELDAHYIDLENRLDQARIEDFATFYETHGDRLVIIDEVQRRPGLFEEIRGVIDAQRRKGRRTGLFLFLGSASRELMAQSGESLAGRIRYLELQPVDWMEYEGKKGHSLHRLWLRGGFPESLLASDDEWSLRWREDLIRTYLERDIPTMGPRIPASTLERLWTMIAHQQGGTLNMSQLARSIDMSVPTIDRYLDLLTDLFLIRRLNSYSFNTRKRMVKAPKLYVSDSGMANALLHLGTMGELLGHPASGGTWEGFVISNLLSSAPSNVQGHFYRSANGEEIDLLLELPKGRKWAIEIKRSSVPTLSKGFYRACEDIGADTRFVVYDGREDFMMSDGVRAVPLSTLMGLLMDT
jgi:predicted AAA+ superfamily ATPase